MQSHLILNLAMIKKKGIKQVNSYIENNLNPAKLNVIDPTKDNFTQPMSVEEILDELKISNVDYYKALSISKD